MEDFIEIDLVGNFNHNWPDCKIFLNDTEIYNSKIINSKTLKTTFNIKNLNLLSIEHFNKKGSETTVVDGKITNDKYFFIKNIKINHVSIKDIWHLGYYIKNKEKTFIEPEYENLWFFENCVYYFNFESPFYNWVIDKKREGFKEIGPSYKKSVLNTLPDKYSISSLEFESLIDKIKKDLEAI